MGLGRMSVLVCSAAWVAVGVFWWAATKSQHPTPHLAIVTTTALLVAYAAVFFLNHGVLVPRLHQPGRVVAYWCALLFMMLAGTALALAVIRLSYTRVVGPEPDLAATIRLHFLIDFIGMVVHQAGASALLVAARRWASRRALVPATHAGAGAP